MEQIEIETRYLRPQGFKPPKSLSGMFRGKKTVEEYVDHYYDARGEDGKPILRKQKATLRLRKYSSGETVATFKERGFESEVGVARRETEARLTEPDRNPAIAKAEKLTQGKELKELFRIECTRVNYTYKDEQGELQLSEDSVSYPDGSQEERVEVELKEGPEWLLQKAHRKIVERNPGIQEAARGKQQEARIRLAELL